MAVITTIQRAPILLDTDNAHLSANAYTAESSDPAVAAVATTSLKLWVDGLAEGSATINVTRKADGSVATLDVTVVAEAPFSIHLGSPIAR